jgi:protoheme IX farnesyltransferase
MYYRLTKPGIVYGNLLTIIAGFLFASKWHIVLKLFASTVVGMALVIAAACVYNNFIDRGIDKRMARTKKRALVRGEISGSSALTFASVLLVVGFFMLAMWTNALVVWAAVIGFVDYVVLYGWSKRTTPLSTLVGSVSGSAPIVAGYVAASNHFDASALILFLIMTFWQMPHFYAIGMYRFDDYKAAGLPVLPVARGANITKRHIVAYIVAFLCANAALTIFGKAGITYAIVVCGLSLVWLARGRDGFRHHKDDAVWAKKMFLFSLIVVTTFSAILSVGSLLP